MLFDARCEVPPAVPALPTPREPAASSSGWSPLLFLPLWLATTFGLIALAIVLRNTLHPGHVGLPLANTSDQARVLMVVPPMLGSCFIAMFATNFIIHHATRKRDVLAQGIRRFQGVEYAAAQRAVLRIGVPIVIVVLLMA